MELMKEIKKESCPHHFDSNKTALLLSHIQLYQEYVGRHNNSMKRKKRNKFLSICVMKRFYEQMKLFRQTMPTAN